ncbi:MAG: patatin-like phospholipase family protein [Treponema sp.]|nr:patatin-like phospholipase family protein [Treponema sp.]
MKKILTLFILISMAASVCFGQAEKKSVLDPESFLALQDVPFHEGIEEFEAKIQKIRDEEGREPLCLVMCGGSARAFCHVGMLKALEENDVVPDFIIANSMGAVIGMLYAYGFSPEKIEEVISKINLSSYFEPVMPLHGGLLSVRKYEAMINQLLGEESHRVEDCAIPILLLTEDLYTKRQVWHASGDFAKIMDAAFAMSAFMEPTKYKLEDGTPVSLIDSGSIDIAGLKIAKHFSDNIIISTAFYDKKVNYNNPIVIINRTFSIGKERVAIHDIMELQPVLIRNDVEHFSFMEFQNSHEISAAGYKSTIQMIDEITALEHKSLASHTALAERRKVTDQLADDEIIRVEHRIPAKIIDPYFGVKAWPVFGVVDFQDAYLYNRDGISIEAFADLPGVMLKGKANFPFNFGGVSSEAQITVQPSEILRFDLLGSYYFDFKDSSANNFYAFGGVNISPAFFPGWMKALVATAEYQGDNLFKPQAMLFTTGLKTLFGKENSTYLFEKPYIYVERLDSNPFSFGIGNDISSCWNFLSFLGAGEYSNLKFNCNSLNLNFLNRNEIYWVSLNPGITAAEAIILQQIKLGAYYEIAGDYEINSNTAAYGQTVGGFVRGDISVIGLSNFIIDTGYAWKLEDKAGKFFFTLKARM